MFSYIKNHTENPAYQYRSLSDGMLDLILLDEMFLLECFDSVYLLCVLLFTEDDLAIGAGADDFDQFEIVNIETAIR